jgi:hypothetical protein
MKKENTTSKRVLEKAGGVQDMNDKFSKMTTIMAFPVVLAVGILLIPVVADYSDHLLAEQAVEQTFRWFTGHILSAIGFGLSILAVSTVDRHARSISRALTGWALPFITIGAGLYAAGLGADGIGPLAVRSAGYSAVIFFDGSGVLVPATFMSGTILFGIGLLSTVIDAGNLGLIKGWSRIICFVSALLFMAAPAIPSGWGLYGVAVAVFGVFVPLARAVSR